MRAFKITTQEKEELYDITELVGNVVAEIGIRHGICNVFTPHSTAAVVVMENVDPALHDDFLDSVRDVIPLKAGYHHDKRGRANAHAHIKSALINPNVTLIVDHGRVLLGSWQGIMFCEFDGPRERAVHVEVIGK